MEEIQIAQLIADVMTEKGVDNDAAISAILQLLASMAKLSAITKEELVDLVSFAYDKATIDQ